VKRPNYRPSDLFLDRHYRHSLRTGSSPSPDKKGSYSIRWLTRRPFAMIAAAFMAVTLVPVLCGFLLKGQITAGGMEPGNAFPSAHL